MSWTGKKSKHRDCNFSPQVVLLACMRPTSVIFDDSWYIFGKLSRKLLLYICPFVLKQLDKFLQLSFWLNIISSVVENFLECWKASEWTLGGIYGITGTTALWLMYSTSSMVKVVKVLLRLFAAVRKPELPVGKSLSRGKFISFPISSTE